ncbi:unnamed protein product [Amoebophrya sp. A120]|nr:unnamed protein product [Amoebophrya sp. A120]|eukprot:GSA120T00021451001.1
MKSKPRDQHGPAPIPIPLGDEKAFIALGDEIGSKRPRLNNRLVKKILRVAREPECFGAGTEFRLAGSSKHHTDILGSDYDYRVRTKSPITQKQRRRFAERLREEFLLTKEELLQEEAEDAEVAEGSPAGAVVAHAGRAGAGRVECDPVERQRENRAQLLEYNYAVKRVKIKELAIKVEAVSGASYDFVPMSRNFGEVQDLHDLPFCGKTRPEIDRELDAFFENNKPMQAVVRILKAQTAIVGGVPGVWLEVMTMRAASLLNKTNYDDEDEESKNINFMSGKGNRNYGMQLQNKHQPELCVRVNNVATATHQLVIDLFLEGQDSRIKQLLLAREDKSHKTKKYTRSLEKIQKHFAQNGHRSIVHRCKENRLLVERNSNWIEQKEDCCQSQTRIDSEPARTRQTSSKTKRAPSGGARPDVSTTCPCSSSEENTIAEISSKKMKKRHNYRHYATGVTGQMTVKIHDTRNKQNNPAADTTQASGQESKTELPVPVEVLSSKVVESERSMHMLGSCEREDQRRSIDISTLGLVELQLEKLLKRHQEENQNILTRQREEILNLLRERDHVCEL